MTTQYNKDAVMKAFAKAYVYDRKEILMLVKRYGFNVQNPTNADVLAFFSKMQGNDKFYSELIDILRSKKYLLIPNYRSITGIEEAIAGVSTMLGSAFDKIGMGKEHQLGLSQVSGDNTANMLAYMSSLEEQKAKDSRNKLIFVTVAGLGATALVGFLIFKK